MRSIIRLLGAVLALLPGAAWSQVTSGPFRDVPKDHWAYQAIEDLRQKGILVGYPDQTKPKAKSGVEGTAEIGPIRPVQRPGERNTRPLSGAIIVLQSAETGKEVARAKTGTSGRFRLTAAPGKYRLAPLSPNPKSRFPIGRPQNVEVKEGEITHVTVQYDSGIR